MSTGRVPVTDGWAISCDEEDGVPGVFTDFHEFCSTLPMITGDNLGNILRAQLEHELPSCDVLQLINSNWSREWRGWIEFGEAVHQAARLSEEEREDWVLSQLVVGHLRKFIRIAQDNVDLPIQSDEERLVSLSLQGLNAGRGLVYGRNDCLADSLLQSLVHAHVFTAISVDERNEGCRLSRQRLVASDDVQLRPRKRDPFSGADEGEDPSAFLQHDVHAGAIVDFFANHFENKIVLP